jgi:hypothetical protein
VRSGDDGAITKKARRKGPQRANSGPGIVGRGINPFQSDNAVVGETFLAKGSPRR